MGTIKFRNGKALGLLIASISALSFIGVGFASWTITQTATTPDFSSGITADASVQTHALSLSAAAANANQRIAFAPRSTDSSGWLHTATSASEKESLDATFAWDLTFVTTDATNTIYFKGLALSLVSNATGYTSNADVWTDSSVTTDGLVGTLPVYMASAPAKTTTADQDYYEKGWFNVTVTAGAGTTISSAFAQVGETTVYSCGIAKSGDDSSVYTLRATVTVNIHFAWGNKFGHKNPIDYFHGKSATYDSAVAAEASEKLDALKALNSTATSYKLAFTVDSSN